MASYESGEIDDHTVFQFIKDKKDISGYSRIHFNQIFSRKYYKSLWKTPFEFYRIFGDSLTRMKIKNLIENEHGVSGIPKNEMESLLESQFSAENKFIAFIAKFRPFSESESYKNSIFIDIGGESRKFSEIFLPSIYAQSEEILTKVPYVFIDDSLVPRKNDILDFLITSIR